MSTLTLDIPEDVKQQLDQLSEQKQVSSEDLVRESLRRYLIKEEIKRIRSFTVPLAQAAGYFTDEDIFRDMS